MRGPFSVTAEQEAIVDAAAAGNNLVIEAGAGTGKTSTLVLVADSLQGRGIYVAFNRQIVDEARRKFGPEVSCYTAHQLAYDGIGHPYATRLGGRRMRYVEVAGQLGMKGPLRLSDGKSINPVPGWVSWASPVACHPTPRSTAAPRPGPPEEPAGTPALRVGPVLKIVRKR